MIIKNALKFIKIVSESAPGPVAATPRKSMKKIHQMGKQDFVALIKALNSKLNGTSLNLSDLKVSEKVDGQAMRLGVLNGEIGGETSSSGLVFKPYKLSQDGHRKLLKHFQTAHGEKMLALADKFGDFKVIGELFYIRGPELVDDDGSITFVATKYDTQKLGSLGAIILFDAEGLENGKPVKVSQERKEAIIRGVKSMSDETFKVFDGEEISWHGDIDIVEVFDTPKAKEAFENPDTILKWNKEDFEAIRDSLAKAFSNQIAKKGSVLGLSDSIVEGIVFQIGDSKFGATNFSWKNKKEQIHKQQIDFQDTVDNFYKSIFGTIYTAKVREAAKNEPEKYQSAYAAALPAFKKKLSQIMDEFETADMPKNMKFNLKNITGLKFAKFNKLTDDISSLVAMLSPKTK